MQAGAGAEPLASQKRIQLFNSIVIIALFVLSALDAGLGWSAVPITWIIIGHAFVALGFLVIAMVFRENTFAAATVAIAEGQRVISTGLYSFARHPMYAGALILFLGIPPALASWWGLLMIVPLLGGLIARLLDEERYLTAHLTGYADYCRRVRHRLVPGVW